MVGHPHTPLVLAASNPAAREPHADNNTHISRHSAGSGFGRRFYGMTWVLKQAPYAPHIKAGRLVFCFPAIPPGRAPRCIRATSSGKDDNLQFWLLRVGILI
jgi:hypothetical protein